MSDALGSITGVNGATDLGRPVHDLRSRRRDSNPQPPDYKSGALPIAPRRRALVIVAGAGFAGRHRPAGRPVVHQEADQATMIGNLPLRRSSGGPGRLAIRRATDDRAARAARGSSWPSARTRAADHRYRHPRRIERSAAPPPRASNGHPDSGIAVACHRAWPTTYPHRLVRRRPGRTRAVTRDGQALGRNLAGDPAHGEARGIGDGQFDGRELRPDVNADEVFAATIDLAAQHGGAGFFGFRRKPSRVIHAATLNPPTDNPGHDNPPPARQPASQPAI
jgi:hypothetical protein